MAWVCLIGFALALWAVCGAVIGVGRKLWSLETTLRVHLVAAPVFAFIAAAGHTLIAPQIHALPRAAAIAAVVIILDAAVVAPLFERSYAMFRSVIGTWLPFALIFLASWAAGVVMKG